MDNPNVVTKDDQEQLPVDQNTPASPEELGVGQRQSNEPFSPIDFDTIIDNAFGEKTEQPEVQPTEELKTEEPPKSEESKEDQPEQEAETKQEVQEGEAQLKEEEKKEPENAAPKEAEQKETENKEQADLDSIESKLGTHTSPKTKTLFKEVKELAAKERAERQKVAKELEEARKQLQEVQKTKDTIPQNVQEEINQLRDRLRQFDANADPAIVQKYDKTIERNNETILKTLVDAGLPKEHADKLKKNGVTLANLRPYLETLETGKGADGKQYDADPDTAERIRETIRENLRVSKEKDREINDWRTNFEQRNKQLEEENQKQLQEATQRLTKEFDLHLNKWDFLKKPSDVADTDAPAIRKQKEEAIARYNDLSLKFADTIKKETTNPLDAQISARVGILYRDYVAPELQSKLAQAQKEIESLKAQVGKMKQSGSAAKSIGTNAPRASAKAPVNMNEGFDDIVDSLAAQIAQTN